VNNSFVIDMKQSTPAGPTKTPNMGCQNNRKKLLVSNGQWELGSRPPTIEPFVVHKSTITNGNRCVRTDKKVRQRLEGGKKEKGYTISLTKTFYPPGQVLSKLYVKTYWMRIIAETGQ